MEDDDEFGDLYTDVLRPLMSASAPQLSASQSAAPPVSRQVDLNVQTGDEVIPGGAPSLIPGLNFTTSSSKIEAPILESEKAAPELVLAGSSDSRPSANSGNEMGDREVEKEVDIGEIGRNWASESTEPTVSRVMESGADVKLQKTTYEDPNYMDESGIDIIVEERDDKDDFLGEKDPNFQNLDVKEADGEIGDLASEPTIPGLSVTGAKDDGVFQRDGNFVARDEASGEGDDWDSDSEDDLQIVLNDNLHGPAAMDRSGAVGTDDDDEDEDDPLVIVADSNQIHQPIDEQEWGEDAAQGADGERKDLADAAKVNGGVMVPPKIGFNNHGYHPFHSQFKYVRPGAAPIPGPAPVGPGGVPSQIRPPIGVAPIAGRGRGDWRPAGTKNAPPMQKNFHPGFGMPAWGSNTAGRGYGLEFTLPSHKTIFDVEVDSFDEKPWRLPGIDVTDFFNFELNEESWKDYCKQLEHLRLEGTMQSKIRVYESGRAEQEYDPDLPPELAAAAGMHGVSSDNPNIGKADAGQTDLGKVSIRVRPPLPTGRAIQVECGYGERLPSIDTRPPRIRDSDAIIEIVLQDSGDDDSFPENDAAEQPGLNEDVREGLEIEEVFAQNDIEHLGGSPHGYGDKMEPAREREPLSNTVHNISEQKETLRLSPREPSEHPLGSRGRAPVSPNRNSGSPHEERRTKGRTQERSPDMTPNEGTQNKRYHDYQREESVESIGGKHGSGLSSPHSAGASAEQGLEHGDEMLDEVVLADGSSEMDRDKMELDETNDSLKEDNSRHFTRRKKLHSRVEQHSVQDFDDGGDLKATRSSENSKAISGSSRDFQKMHDGFEEEVVQDGHSARTKNFKRPLGEDEQTLRRKGHDERSEMERHRMIAKGREDSFPRRDWDPSSGHHLHAKTEGVDRRKERDNSDGSWQWRDDSPHIRRTRAEDTRKRDRVDEIGSRHRVKVRESERNDKDEHLLSRKPLENGSWKGHHDKDTGSRHRERDENLKSRYDNVDEMRSKRRKEEEYIRRDHAVREENLHGSREITTSRKRERDDILDPRKRDVQARKKEDDYYTARHKDENWLQKERVERLRERDEWHRLKQSHEETSSKRERDEGRAGMRSGRAIEDQIRVNHARVKDEYKISERDYQSKEGGRQGEQLKRRDRMEDGSLSHHRGHVDVHERGSQLSNDERLSRQERASSRNDRAVNTSDNYRVTEKKHRENTRKTKESEIGDNDYSGHSNKNQGDHGRQKNETVMLKGTNEQEVTTNHHSTRKHREDASSDEEQQDSRRGRSKLERWTSHKEREFIINSKSSSSLKIKEVDKYNNGGSSLPGKLPDVAEEVDNQQPLGDEKNAGNSESKNVDAKGADDKHLDTVAKLKKRSERFKLPMPSEKEAIAIKKMESEPLPSAQTETVADSEIKQERPARKRRWISN